MRVVLASADVESTAWLEPVLASGGFAVMVVPDCHPESPELRGADVVIVDRDTAFTLAPERSRRHLLLAPRGGTLSLDQIRSGIAGIIVVPSDESEIVERVRLAGSRT